MKVKLYIAMSLDGYVADIKSGVDFLKGDGSDEDNFGSYTEFYDSIDTVILGHNTYQQIKTELSPDEWPYEGKSSYVLTNKKIDNTDNIIFTNEDIIKLIDKLKKENGKGVWICGGANIVNQFHEKGLIDQYIISVIPTILGDGIKLFAKHDLETKLKLISTKSYNGIVDLIYEKR